MNQQGIYSYVVAFILVSAGIAHFLFPAEFEGAVPEPFRPEKLWVYITGLLEFAGAVGILLKRYRRLTGYILVLYFIMLLPAHFEMLIGDHEIFGISDRYFFIARIFFQIIPIMIAWKARHSDVPGIWPGLDRLDKALAERWAGTYSWQSKWLWVAAWYNIGFGFWTVVFPTQAFELFGMEPPRYPFIWQTVGMVVGVYGIGYGVAAFNELKHFPIVLVGFLGKIFGPIGFVVTFFAGDLPLAFGVLLIFNDLIWYPAFWGITKRFTVEYSFQDLIK